MAFDVVLGGKRARKEGVAVAEDVVQWERWAPQEFRTIGKYPPRLHECNDQNWGERYMMQPLPNKTWKGGG